MLVCDRSIGEGYVHDENSSKTCMVTFSGECAPGPGFFVLSPGMELRPVMEYAGSFVLTEFGSETRYVPGPGVCGMLKKDSIKL